MKNALVAGLVALAVSSAGVQAHHSSGTQGQRLTILECQLRQSEDGSISSRDAEKAVRCMKRHGVWKLYLGRF